MMEMWVFGTEVSLNISNMINRVCDLYIGFAKFAIGRLPNKIPTTHVELNISNFVYSLHVHTNQHL